VADKVGLTDALSEALAPTRERPSVHDPGEVVRDLCVVLADGGDCLSDSSPASKAAAERSRKRTWERRCSTSSSCVWGFA